jgi:hypothetical protein
MDQEFRWVTATARCSPFEVFKLLQKGAEQDVADRMESRKPNESVAFRLSIVRQDCFMVLRDGPRISSCIEFTWSESGIQVRGDENQLLLDASLTLNDDGECRLRIGKELLTFWQLRKRALEDLFFRF